MFPQPFIDGLVKSMGQKSASSLLEVMEAEPPVTIRINPSKISTGEAGQMPVGDFLRNTLSLPIADEPGIPYSPYGYVLSRRPEFTFDPAFQAGAYYVQEASSMSIELVKSLIVKMREQNPSQTLKVLDLCAAPGGKSTHILSLLREFPGSFLVSNEVIQSRATVLAGNMVKWGASNVVVTNNDPADFKRLPSYFDVVFVDAPCSGEGMFRKDPRAVEEWSEEGVKTCAARQRRILSDVWGSLKDGGLLVYSTCTFNRTENDDNIAWLALSYGAEPLVTEHLYPGRTYGEGFFFSIVRKHGEAEADPRQFFVQSRQNDASQLKQYKLPVPYLKDGYRLFRKGNLLKAYPASVCTEMLFVEQKLRTLAAGTAVATVLEGRRKGEETLIPEPDIALSEALRPGAFPEVELFDSSSDDSRAAALRYLRREPVTFPGAPSGYLLLTWCGIPLGFVKNLGNRCNSLWPPSWRIRT